MRWAVRLSPWNVAAVSVVLTWAMSVPSEANAQLVNPGFEESTAMPVAPGMWNLLSGWGNAGSGSSSPDFFHLDGALGGDLPETPIAMVQPAEGRGIAGIAAIKRVGPGQPLSREYLVMEMAEPLEVGQRYTLSFDVTNGAWLPTSAAGLAVNGLGIAFSVDEPVQMGNGALPIPSTFQFPYARYDEDWERVSFTFLVAGPSRYMTIGVFGDDDELEAEAMMGKNPVMAYYFFDGFQIEEYNPEEGMDEANLEVKGPDAKPDIEGDIPVFVPNAFSPNGDGLNDLFRPEVGVAKPSAFEIYSRWGQQIVQLDPGNPVWDGRDMSGHLVEPGIYVWRMEWPRTPGLATPAQQGQVTILR